MKRSLSNTRTAVYRRNKRKLRKFLTAFPAEEGLSIPRSYFISQNDGQIENVNPASSCENFDRDSDDIAVDSGTGAAFNVENENELDGDVYNDDDQNELDSDIHDDDNHNGSDHYSSCSTDEDWSTTDDSSLDAPARAAVACHTQYNGYFGCLYCYAKGRSLGPGKFVYPLSQCYQKLRTDAELRVDMASVFDTGKVKRGVKNISSLVALPLFNINKGVIVESMHAVYLGVDRQHTRLLLTKTKAPYYVGSPKSLKLIDEYKDGVERRNRLIGFGKCTLRSPTVNERALLNEKGFDPANLKCFQKMKLNGTKYTCESYKKLKVCDSTVHDGNDTFGIIVNMVQFHNNEESISGMFIKRMQLVGPAFNTTYINQVRLTNNICFIQESSLIKPAVQISSSGNLYVIKQTNCWETD
ncbi:hypothetical protein KQX54_006157 [Cotesia glomerata]|uniref:Uncharacterized protein n=1 Tax=Cotesia glomerata TaxID=32391 RepID=A0AAV7J1H4_COTGL|nr:hypothetical protein KQX54_006157 [Cotesia glomerata]